MKYTIYRGAQVVVADITPEGTVTEKIMGEETVNITFSHTSKIEFHIDDKITVYGKDYFLSADPVTVKKSSREFQYTLLFFSVKYALSDVQMFFYDDENELTLPDFSIMGTAEDCLNVILANANRAQSGWSKGTVDETEVKNVSFSDCKCLEAISKIADEFELEYWIDSDKSIHFTERKPVSGYSFEYGKAKGLKDTTRSVLEGGSLVTRLYVKGAEKNLPKNYRGGQKNLRIDVPYLEKNTNVYGIKEHIESFPDIFPRRVGNVTSVDANDPNRFTDADLDFDLNAYNEYGTTVLLNGIAAKVIFQTGQLAGYRFELLETGGFSSATKTFYLNPNKDEKDLQLPSESMRPAVGDQYILEDIMMPEVYVLQAEAELKNKGQEYLDQNSKERFQYAVISDILYFKNQNINVLLGHTVHFKDVDFGLDDAIRITGLQKNIQNPYDVKFDLSEVTAVSSIVQSYYEQQEQTNTIITSIKYNAELARRNYLFAREFHDNVFDGEGYYKAENIKPLSIETKMLSLGSRLQQFGLPGVNFQLQNNNALSNTAGKIAHQTIDPNAIREWNISANTVIGITNNFNYIYIKCQKIGTNANFVVTQAQIKVEQDPDFYHFEVGYLSSVVDGYRKIKTTYGFAQLNPAELSIGRISDPTGNNYIDLLQDRITIKAKVEFTSDSPAYNQINDTIIVGGRNLLLKSDEFKENGGYPTATYYLAPNEYKNGEEYTITIWGNLGVGKTVFAIYNTGRAVDLCALQKVEDGKYQAVFNWTNERNGIVVENIYINVFPFEVGANAVSTISKIKLEKGNKGTDWTPAPEDVSAEIQDVRDYLNDFENEINTTFSDGLISQAEAISIEKYINQLEKEKADVVNKFNQVFSNPNLVGTPKSNLQTAYLGFTNSHSDLINVINEAISDGKTTQSEKADVDEFFIYYKNSVATLTTRFEEAQKSIETTSIQNIQIGGRNLLLKSDKAERKVWWINFELAEKIVGDYVLQIWCSDTIENGGGIGFGNDSGYDGSYFHYPTLKNGYQEIPLKNLNSGNNTHLNVYANNMTKIDKIKLEIGTKATDWTPAPEDTVNDINNIQIGGRNLFRGALFLNGSDYSASSIRDIGKISGFNGGQFNAYQFLPTTIPSVANQQYTASVEVRINNNATNVDAGIYFEYPSNAKIINVGNIAPNVWKRLEFTSDKIVNPSAGILALMSGVGNPTTIIEYRNFKFERGSRATDWTPAPEDVQSQIDTANQSSANALAQAQNAYNTAQATASVTNFLQTTIDGNVVSTGTLQVGDVVGANAFISGVTDKPNGESIRFGAGKPYTQKQNSPFQVLDNGMVRFVNPLTGQRVFELGFNQAIGKVVFDIFGENGAKIVTIGQKGIEFLGYISDGFTQVGFTKLSTTSFVKATMEAELKTLLRKRVVTNSPRTYEVTQPPNVQTHYYDAGRNFETVSNEIYIGYHYDTNKFSAFIADGIYVGIPDNPLFLDAGESFVSFYSVAHKIQNGKVVDSMGITAEGLISEINN